MDINQRQEMSQNAFGAINCVALFGTIGDTQMANVTATTSSLWWPCSHLFHMHGADTNDCSCEQCC